MTTLGDLPDLNPDNNQYTSEERRNEIRSTIIAFVSSGVSKRETLFIYQKSGLGINRSDFNQIYDEVANQDKQATRIKNVNKSAIPTEKILAKARIDIPNKYRFVASLTLYNTETEEKETQLFSIDVDELYSVGEIEKSISDFFLSFESNSKYEVNNTRIEKGFIRSDN